MLTSTSVTQKQTSAQERDADLAYAILIELNRLHLSTLTCNVRHYEEKTATRDFIRYAEQKLGRTL